MKSKKREPDAEKPKYQPTAQEQAAIDGHRARRPAATRPSWPGLSLNSPRPSLLSLKTLSILASFCQNSRFCTIFN
ncbi:MAG TPA: hypothetical protein VN362_05925, partial [Xanthobacteraceae bacterium]|nr:hypothetical protein [Xanthobacteraceae bacterium]